MKNNKMEAALNEQINAEFYSAYLYLAMAAYFEKESFKGFATWMRVQAKEEMGHAMKIFDYIHNRRWQVNLTSIAAIKTSSFKSILDIFEKSFAHEQKITKSINKLMDIAIATKDYATQSFLQWFIDEQVEEEATVEAIVDKIKLIGKNSALLLILDNELGKRGG